MYSWRVPRDLRLAGDKETFTATVTFDTKHLFGKCNAICRIKLKNPPEKKDADKAKK